MHSAGAPVKEFFYCLYYGLAAARQAMLYSALFWWAQLVIIISYLTVLYLHIVSYFTVLYCHIISGWKQRSLKFIFDVGIFICWSNKPAQVSWPSGKTCHKKSKWLEDMVLHKRGTGNWGAYISYIFNNWRVLTEHIDQAHHTITLSDGWLIYSNDRNSTVPSNNHLQRYNCFLNPSLIQNWSIVCTQHELMMLHKSVPITVAANEALR
jgi:hypothetical protein